MMRKSMILIGMVAGVWGTTLPAQAGPCSADISRLNASMKDQYEPFSWATLFYCPVARGSELRKDALVTASQLRRIAQDVSLATYLDRAGRERDCREALVTAKTLLRLR